MDYLDYTILGHAAGHFIDGNAMKEAELLRVKLVMERLKRAGEVIRKAGREALGELLFEDFSDNPEDKFMKKLLLLLWHGYTEEYVGIFTRNKLAVLKPESFDTYMIARAFKDVQYGALPEMIEEMCYSMLPEQVADKIQEWNKEPAESIQEQVKKTSGV